MHHAPPQTETSPTIHFALSGALVVRLENKQSINKSCLTFHNITLSLSLSILQRAGNKPKTQTRAITQFMKPKQGSWKRCTLPSIFECPIISFSHFKRKSNNVVVCCCLWMY